MAIQVYCGERLSETNFYVYLLDQKVDEEELRNFIKKDKETANHLASKKEISLVFPRKGTISPWASKAYDIFKISNVKVSRIERGILHLDKNFKYDRMTQTVFTEIPQDYFKSHDPKPLKSVEMISSPTPRDVLVKANTDWGLALASDEIDYLITSFLHLKRNPSDVELMMFAQVNSEHCRHKIFGASWTIDGKDHETSLFSMIKNTFKLNPKGILSAYHDNAAVLEGPVSTRFYWDENKVYKIGQEAVHTLIKVETHNHPTAVSPFPGAATGSGGEIRDEAAVGQGSKTKAGLTGFTVSNLRIPGYIQPWEVDYPGCPSHISEAFDIMIEAPLGGMFFILFRLCFQ